MATALLVADAGPLIALAVADVLPQTIALYQSLLVPQAVIDECTAMPSAPGIGPIQAALRGSALRVIAEADIAPLDPAYARGLGSGEVAVLAYAAQHRHVALIDDRRARGIAQRLGVVIVGSGAVLLSLKVHRHIESRCFSHPGTTRCLILSDHNLDPTLSELFFLKRTTKRHGLGCVVCRQCAMRNGMG